MARAGRELELVIKRLEESNLPDGAIIKSPGYLIDKVTSQSREVDILIEHKIGTVDIKIAIECRDRKSVQDTTWIEQLISKHRDMHVDKMIVVSSGKFTKQAIQKAANYNIELRNLEEIDSNLIKCWWKVEFVSVNHTKILILSLRINLVEDYESVPNIEYDINKELVYCTNEKVGYSLNTLVTNAVNSLSTGLRMIHGSNTPFLKEVQLTIENSEDPQAQYYIANNQDKYFIKNIDFIVEITFIEKKEYLSKSSVYKNNQEDLSYLWEYKNIIPETDSKLEIIKNSSGGYKMVLHKNK